MLRRNFFKKLGMGFALAACEAHKALGDLIPLPEPIPITDDWVTYRYHFTAVVPPNVNLRLRYVEAVSLCE